MKTLRMVTKIGLSLALGATLALAAGCGGKSNSNSASSQPATSMSGMSGMDSSSAASPASQVPANAIKVQMSEFKYDPSTIDATAGKVTFDLINVGTVPHDLGIQLPSGMQMSPQVQPGASALWTVTLAAGTYKAECTLPGHAASGMKATIVVK